MDTITPFVSVYFNLIVNMWLSMSKKILLQAGCFVLSSFHFKMKISVVWKLFKTTTEPNPRFAILFNFSENILIEFYNPPTPLWAVSAKYQQARSALETTSQDLFSDQFDKKLLYDYFLEVFFYENSGI